MALSRARPESAGDRCFACSGAISGQDLAVYLYRAWFHLDCYQRENNLPDHARAVPRAVRPPAGPSWAVQRLISWITDTSPLAPSTKDPVAVELGRRGGLKGGPIRAARLSPARRAAIARNAARARWAAKER
jgi:hypothetical protein